MDFFNEEIKTIFILVNTVILIIILVIVFPTEANQESEDIKPIIEDTLEVEETENVQQIQTIRVDIKGMIEVPGVYEIAEGTIINDLIQKAGGLKKGASTKYINLSKKLENEMVIYIYSDEELTTNEIKEECHCDPIIIKECIEKESSIIIPDQNINSKDDEKTSINNATKEELMKITGIGEAKASAIIKYREENGPFNTIEDIKKVDGISESLYEKIKYNLKL